MKGHTLLTLLATCIYISGCAIHTSTPINHFPQVIALPQTYAVPSWTGDIRISVGTSNQDVEGQDLAIIEGTVKGLLDQAGITTKVECLDRNGDIGAIGALHARIRVDFANKITLEQKFEALSVLSSLQPTDAAYVNNTPKPASKRAPLTVAAHLK